MRSERAPLHLRVFISSPGDVEAERRLLMKALEELPRDPFLADRVTITPVAWDDPAAPAPMVAGVTPQAAINRYKNLPADCDLTVVILWGKIGTLLAQDILRGDGTRYESGTVWEFENALLGRETAGHEVWVYRCLRVPEVRLDDPEFDDRPRQLSAVDAFCARITRYSDGSFRGAVNHYETADELIGLFIKQFKQYARLRLDEIAAGASGDTVHGDRSSASPPTARPVPKPVLRLPQHAIVGRQTLVERVLAGLRAGMQDFAFVYLPGVGKTAVAAELIGSEAIMRHFPDGVLWAHLGQDPDVGRQLLKWAKAIGLPPDEIPDPDFPEELAEAIVAAIGEGRMLLVVDDVWTTSTGQHLMLYAPNCARVITTRYQNVARELMPNADALVEVRKLSPDDGYRLLDDLAPHAARLAPKALRDLAARVDGLPIALVLIGKMLKRDGDDDHAIHATLNALGDIGEVFREKKTLEYKESANLSLAEVIEASYRALGTAGVLTGDALSGDRLRTALEALSILRPDPAWFPVSLARQLVDEADAALPALANAGLIELVRYDTEGAPGRQERRYTMHRMIAEYMRGKFVTQRKRLQALNRLAADHYLAQLTELETAYQQRDASSYSFMYRYEDPEWQDCQDNWLYYFAQTGYDREASLSFLRAWFDGFWWWGCFTAEGYDFCDQLLNDWDHRLSLSASGDRISPALNEDRIERLMSGLELLRRFKRAYPKETEDRRGGAWADVQETLGELRHRTGLARDLAQLSNADARHVRALTDIFLAEAHRFGDRDSAAAEGQYREALALFRAAGDNWNVAWALYHLADMLCDCGRHDEARPLGLEAIELGDAGGDHEVVALAHRLIGDVALATRSANDAARNFRLAVERAYRFQVRPAAPDAYTIQFYADVCRAVAARVQASDDVMPEQARFIATMLRQGWLDSGAELAPEPDGGIDLTGVAVEDLAAQLFPPGLPLARLKADGRAYETSVKKHLFAIDWRDAHASAIDDTAP